MQRGVFERVLHLKEQFDYSVGEKLKLVVSGRIYI